MRAGTAKLYFKYDGALESKRGKKVRIAVGKFAEGMVDRLCLKQILGYQPPHRAGGVGLMIYFVTTTRLGTGDDPLGNIREV